MGLHWFCKISRHIWPSAYTVVAKAHAPGGQHKAYLQLTIGTSTFVVDDVLFGWNILERKRTVGALFGYSSVNCRVNLKVPVPSRRPPSRVVRMVGPSSHTFKRTVIQSAPTPHRTGRIRHVRRAEREISHRHSTSPPSHTVSSGPKMTAFHAMRLLSFGDALMPCGGSFCILL